MKTPLFSSAINLKLEPELHQALAAAARDERTTLSEFARRTLRARIGSRSDTSHDDGDTPGPFRPAPGARIAA
jgi:HicB family